MPSSDCCSGLQHSVFPVFCVCRKAGEVTHSIHVEVVWFVIKLSLVNPAFVAVVDVPNQERHVNGENNEPRCKH